MNVLRKKELGFLLTAKDRRELKDVRTKEQLEKEHGKKLTPIQIRYLEKGIRIQGIWDIETSDFNPYQNFIICYCFEFRDILTGKITKSEYHITKKDISHAVRNNTFNFDEKLLKNLARDMEKCDQLCGHYSTKFDMNYFRSRCLLTNQTELIPIYQKIYYADTWRMMRNSLKANRNTLNNFSLITQGKSEKTPVDLEYWYKIRFKDSPDWEKARKHIITHCRKDVKMTRKGLMRVEKFNVVGGVYT